jgi:hypothetical protein
MTYTFYSNLYMQLSFYELRLITCVTLAILDSCPDGYTAYPSFESCLKYVAEDTKHPDAVKMTAMQMVEILFASIRHWNTIILEPLRVGMIYSITLS